MGLIAKGLHLLGTRSQKAAFVGGPMPNGCVCHVLVANGSRW